MCLLILGWQEYSGKCYKWHKQQSTWSDAESVCESYPSGELVIVESLDHNNWLLNLTRGKSFWTGMLVSLTLLILPLFKWHFICILIKKLNV